MALDAVKVGRAVQSLTSELESDLLSTLERESAYNSAFNLNLV